MKKVIILFTGFAIVLVGGFLGRESITSYYSYMTRPNISKCENIYREGEVQLDLSCNFYDLTLLYGDQEVFYEVIHKGEGVETIQRGITIPSDEEKIILPLLEGYTQEDKLTVAFYNGAGEGYAWKYGSQVKDFEGLVPPRISNESDMTWREYNSFRQEGNDLLEESQEIDLLRFGFGLEEGEVRYSYVASDCDVQPFLNEPYHFDLYCNARQFLQYFGDAHKVAYSSILRSLTLHSDNTGVSYSFNQMGLLVAENDYRSAILYNENKLYEQKLFGTATMMFLGVERERRFTTSLDYYNRWGEELNFSVGDRTTQIKSKPETFYDILELRLEVFNDVKQKSSSSIQYANEQQGLTRSEPIVVCYREFEIPPGIDPYCD